MQDAAEPACARLGRRCCLSGRLCSRTAHSDGLLLRADDAVGGARGALLGAAQLPVLPAITPCVHEGEADGEPLAQVAEGKRGGEQNRDEQQRGHQHAGAGIVQNGGHAIHQQAAGDAFDRDGAQPVHVTGQQTEDSRRDEQEQREAGELRHRRPDGARTDPAHTQQAKHQRQAEGGEAFELEEEIADRGAEDAGPVVRNGVADGVERRVRRAVGDEREEQEAGRGDERHADQLIEPAVAGGRESDLEWLHREERETAAAHSVMERRADTPELPLLSQSAGSGSRESGCGNRTRHGLAVRGIGACGACRWVPLVAHAWLQWAT